MNVLVITGDKKFGPNHERYELQRSAVEQLSVVYWGRGNLWPHIPTGKFDVVTVQDPFWRGVFAWYVARRLKAKFNVQVHTDLSVYTGVRRLIAQVVLRRADSIRVVSERLKRQVERIGVRAPTIVLPVYIDLGRFSSTVRMPHVTKTVLWAGRFEDEKDPLRAIEVFKDVLKVVPSAHLVMLGEGTLQKAVEQQAQRFEQIRLVGWQNPVQYLDTADVVLCTSKHESYGASIVEALAAGVPVVAPDVGVAEEAGATVVRRDELASKVVELLMQPQPAHLRLPGYTRDEWARAWVASLT